MRRMRIRILRHKYRQTWPIYAPAAKGIASGARWPGGKRFAFILTHDVEGPTGRDRCKQLLQLEKDLNFHSGFYFVAEKYSIGTELRDYIARQGFEVGVHGLYHDGKLYNRPATFQQRTPHINAYLKEWNACGFSSPCAHHNLEWTGDLNIRYAITTYDTDPFEPQSCGIGTIFPFRVCASQSGREYIEIPYTLPQDFSLYVLMKEKSIAIWQKKLDWIVQSGGMVHLKTHPDYMSFNTHAPRVEEYPVKYYADFLHYVQQTYSGQYWHVSPSELADFYFTNPDHNAWIHTNGDLLCPACRSSFENKKVLVYGVSGNDDPIR
jgi:hypothetical protein